MLLVNLKQSNTCCIYCLYFEKMGQDAKGQDRQFYFNQIKETYRTEYFIQYWHAIPALKISIKILESIPVPVYTYKLCRLSLKQRWNSTKIIIATITLRQIHVAIFSLHWTRILVKSPWTEIRNCFSSTTWTAGHCMCIGLANLESGC